MGEVYAPIGEFGNTGTVSTSGPSDLLRTHDRRRQCALEGHGWRGWPRPWWWPARWQDAPGRHRARRRAVAAVAWPTARRGAGGRTAVWRRHQPGVRGGDRLPGGEDGGAPTGRQPISHADRQDRHADAADLPRRVRRHRRRGQHARRERRRLRRIQRDRRRQAPHRPHRAARARRPVRRCGRRRRAPGERQGDQPLGQRPGRDPRVHRPHRPADEPAGTGEGAAAADGPGDDGHGHDPRRRPSSPTSRARSSSSRAACATCATRRRCRRSR